VRPGIATAVAHPREQEQPGELLRASQTFLLLSLILPAAASAGRKLYAQGVAVAGSMRRGSTEPKFIDSQGDRNTGFSIGRPSQRSRPRLSVSTYRASP
jgi:hypothetical protein